MPSSAAEVLKERGAKRVYAYCTHAVFSHPAARRPGVVETCAKQRLFSRCCTKVC